MSDIPEDLREVKRLCVLDGENWPKYEFQIEEVLRGKKLWKVVDPGTAPGAHASREVKEDWSDRCDLAFSIISLSCAADIQGDIAAKNKERKTSGADRLTPKELYEYLRTEYAPQSLQAVLRIRRKLSAALASPSSSMRDHISKVAGFYTQLAEIGRPTPEDERCIELLNSLPPAYRHWVKSHKNVSTWAELRAGILEEEEDIRVEEARHTTNPGPNETVFHVGQPTQGPTAGPALGHRHQDRSHAGKGGARGRGSRGPARCHICRQEGHFMSECPHKEAYARFQAGLRPSTQREQAAAVREGSQPLVVAPSAPMNNEPIEDFGFDFACSLGPCHENKNYFILDTASSRHIVSSKEHLADYQVATPGTGIECANGGLMIVEGYGTLKVLTEEGNAITLQEVAHCPSAIGNLIGGKRLTKAGCKISFDDHSASVNLINGGGLVMRARVSGGSWIVQLRPVKELAALIKGKPIVDPVAVHAHHCLGHINQQALKSTAASGLILGIPKTLGDIGFCSHCAQGKLARSPHSRLEAHERATRAMELIHIDIFGPERMQNASALGGWKYGLVFVDDFTKYVWIKLLVQKSDAFTLIRTFCLQASTRLPSLPISRVRSDGALEFKSTALHDFWRNQGVTHEITPRYSPQSNGVAERNVRTLTEMTRTMLIAAKLPSFFWPAAVAMAARISNRVAAAGTKEGKTPHELLFGRPPAAEAIRPFGCVAWAKKAGTERQGKFDPKARPCVYLGPAFRGAARLWDPSVSKEIVEHSVAYDEYRNASAILDVLATASMETSPIETASTSSLSPNVVAPPAPVPQPVSHDPANLASTIQTALDRGVVPTDVMETAKAVAAGARVPIQVLDNLTKRLREVTANRTQHQLEAGRDNQSNEREADLGPRQSSDEAEVGVTVAGQPSPDRAEAVSGGTERRSGRLAGQAPDCGPLLGNRKRKEPGDACLTVLDPEEAAYEDPKTVTEALSRPDRERWLEAMHAEVKSHITRGTWRVVKRDGKANLISSKWVLRLKRNADGTVQKYKARLVARGFTQVEGIDFDETFAPTSRLQNMRLLLAIAAALDMDVHQIDYETAYLNASLQNQIFMLPPEGMDLLGHKYDANDAFELMLALYGLRQSGHEWHRVLRDALRTLDFQQCKIDPTMFVREGDRPAILLVYVDDIIVAAPRGGGIKLVKEELLQLFRGTDLGPAHHCLGIRISRDWDKGTITLDQERYATEILARFGMQDCKPAKTPMEQKASLQKSREGEARADIRAYQAIVGCLAYLAQGTRPDLAYAVSTLGRFNSDPSETHMIAVKRVLRYLKRTAGARLTFGREEAGKVRMEGFVDSDWAADRDDRRSTSGFVFTVGGGAVSWGSRKQGAVALSTAEAEYIAAGTAGREALSIRGALQAAGQNLGTIPVNCDNQAAIQLVKNPGSHHDRSKHIDIAHHWIRDKTSEGAFSFQYIPTEMNPADAFTKPLSEVKHNRHARAIGMALTLETWERGSEGDIEQ